MKLKFLLPLFLFIILCGFLLAGLGIDPKKLPSPLIDKPAPQFTLPQLKNPDKTFSTKDMLGKIWLFNVWASWCVTCRQEHPFLMELSERDIVPIVGLTWKDERDDALQALQKGNPYMVNAFDKKNRVGLHYGVYATPETFLIDKQGIIRHKHIGAINSAVWEGDFMQIINVLKAK